jgi:branched-subunit amino acid aminotransferase/4-amino-4-deoxychorismate lyase
MHATPLQFVTSLENQTGFDVALFVNTHEYALTFETRTATGIKIGCQLKLREREWRDAPMRLDYYVNIAKREMAHALDQHLQRLERQKTLLNMPIGGVDNG